MNMVDDATGRTQSLLCETESQAGAFRLLWKWIENYGIPQALYCDKHSVYINHTEPTTEQQLEGKAPQSQFERACEELGIEIITAHSPQAKGRVERNHAVYQDRFVKMLRLENISTIGEANRYLENTYLPKINAKFAKQARDSADGHVRLDDTSILETILCHKERRVVSNDYCIRYHNRIFQITKQSSPLPRPGTKIMVHETLSNEIRVYAGTTLIPVNEITELHQLRQAL